MGQRLDNLDLPPAGVRHWTGQRKAAVLLAIRHKVISIWDACERYDLSAEELAEWERYLAPDTQPGLIYKALVIENTARGRVGHDCWAEPQLEHDGNTSAPGRLQRLDLGKS
jgi:hypothetical protein